MNRYVLAALLGLILLAGSAWKSDDLAYEQGDSSSVIAADVQHRVRIERATQLAEARP